MDKKFYQQPRLQTTKVEIQNQLLAGSVTNVNCNADMKYGGGGTGAARAGEGGDVWDDE